MGAEQVRSGRGPGAQNWLICAQPPPRAAQLSAVRNRRSGRMAVRLNVTFCVISPALAHARRSPLGTGARTRALGRRDGPDVRVMDCVLGPGDAGVLPEQRERWPEGRVMTPEERAAVPSRA
jgi:hypothetical protein